MALLNILQYPDPLLRRHGIPVTDVKAESIQKIIDAMIQTLLQAENCMALAATQLELHEPPMLTVINNEGNVLCLVNPVITAQEGSSAEQEGCMSIGPGISTVVTRYAQVTCNALDRDGNPFELEAQDYLARCIQHEVDHLYGILYIDKVSALKRSLIEKKLKKMRR